MMSDVRTPNSNPCVKQDLPKQDMSSRVNISMIELSQILAVTRISSFKERHILTSIKSLSTSLDMTDEPNSREIQKDFLCETAK